MKAVFTISIDENLIPDIRAHVRNSSFKNKSHFVQEAIKESLRRKDDF